MTIKSTHKDTCDCCQYFVVSLSMTEHDGGLGDQGWFVLLGMPQHFQGLMVLGPVISYQPGRHGYQVKD